MGLSGGATAARGRPAAAVSNSTTGGHPQLPLVNPRATASHGRTPRNPVGSLGRWRSWEDARRSGRPAPRTGRRIPHHRRRQAAGARGNHRGRTCLLALVLLGG